MNIATKQITKNAFQLYTISQKEDKLKLYVYLLLKLSTSNKYKRNKEENIITMYSSYIYKTINVSFINYNCIWLKYYFFNKMNGYNTLRPSNGLTSSFHQTKNNAWFIINNDNGGLRDVIVIYCFVLPPSCSLNSGPP